MILMFSASNAHAAPICGITPAQILDVTNYYGWNPSDTVFQNQIEGPFQCSEHGDLCQLIGAANAEDYVCDLWDDALAHLSPSTLAANAHNRLLAFEDGNDDDDDGDSLFDAFAFSCPSKKQVVYNSANDRKQKTRAYYTFAIFYAEIGGSSKGWNKSGSNWTKDTAGSVTIGCDYESAGPLSGTCFDYSFNADTDGFVNTHRSAVGVGSYPAPEHVDSSGSYSGIWGSLNGCAYRNAPWNDSSCL